MTIELVRTDGVFALDGGEWEVTNNIWLVGDDRSVLIVDAAHDADVIAEAVNGRRVTAIALTHGHNDHINAAVALLFVPGESRGAVRTLSVLSTLASLSGALVVAATYDRGVGGPQFREHFDLRPNGIINALNLLFREREDYFTSSR